MTVRPGIDAERALERAQSDPAYEAALRDAYRGRHDVLDALWWAAHPLTDSPRGVSDPATGLKVLQRAAYSRASDPTRVGESQHRLHEAQQLIVEGAQHLADALGAVEQGDEPHPVSPLVRDDIAEAVAVPRRKILLPVLTGVALLAAIMVLPALSQLDADADPAPASTARPAERVQTDIVTLGADGNVTDPLAILERPQTEADLPPAGLPLGHDRETFRALPDLVGHVQLYLARDAEPDGVCLVVIRGDNTAMSGCTTEENFAETGVNIGGGNRYALSDTITIFTEQFTLLPDGGFSYDATARMTGEAAFPGTGS